MYKLYLLLLIFSFGCVARKVVNGTNYCPANKDHRHHWVIIEKCNTPGCCGWCKCGWVNEYSTGKWFASKQDAIYYIKHHKRGRYHE